MNSPTSLVANTAEEKRTLVHIYEKPHTRDIAHDEDGMRYYHIRIAGNEHEASAFLTDEMKAALGRANHYDTLVAALVRAYNDLDHIAADTASDVDGMTRAGISDFADKCAKHIDAALKGAA